ncbi:ubiquinone biosynthesis hydroxylase [Bosea sp. TND4EK4]|uniref:ubiquinone biosynthesis hydroxylase n=1 Tax=Bosea sp. TND4EK4 TaxID=1907408 RepID=UPI00095458CE|nr:ubiquinone biosynthesis hydroxylase [Bosea sp. TND4EK4]SIR37328.1 2-octaprenyl-6-methoxyphenol hydroxylase [Bosea sp. TND4EK4]
MVQANASRIVIAGGGISGLALALALKRALGADIEIILADPALSGAPRPDNRAYAIAAAARAMLEALGVWSAVEATAAPMNEMVISDSRTGDAVRPIFLTFDGEVEPGRPFAHMIEAAPLLAHLRSACESAGVVLDPRGVRRFSVDGARVEVNFTDGSVAQAALLVAADGARSKLREQAGIDWVGWSYKQSGIVATIGHERPHHGRAVEHFMPSGPFAILPLADGGTLGHRSSIVWTERTENVAPLLSLDGEDLLAEIETRFGLELGAIALETPASAYPLGYGVARSFVDSRFALLGDAAHLVHPIAGQGLNLGLKDVAALAEVIVDAARLGLDPGSLDVLEAYEKARRFDTVAMGAFMDGMNRLFSNDATPLRLARDLGLGLVDRLPGLKRFFIREAAGIGAGAPRLMRGETL